MEYEDPYETEYSRKDRDQYKSDVDEYECKQCGFEYDMGDQTPPEDATMYWVPHCPYCNANMTENPVTEDRIIVGLMMFRRDDDLGDDWLDKTQTKSRHLHGREIHEFADD